MIIEYGPTNHRRVDRLYSSVMHSIQRYLVSPAVRLNAILPFTRRCTPSARLRRQLSELGLSAERLDWNPWAMKPWKLEFLIGLIEKKPPRCVLELGSGVTTLVLAALAEKHGFELLSLENYHGSIGRLHRLSGGLDCARHIRVQQCVLGRKRSPGGASYFWFNANLEAYRGRFDFVVVDAPAGRLVGRRGTLPEIEPYLAEGHRIVLDDCNRRHERACLAEWGGRYPALNVRQYVDYPDIAVLQLRKTAGRVPREQAA